MATSSFFHDININTPEKAQSFIEALEKAEAIANENSRRKRYETDLINRGCGYWSVCDEAGFACPCYSDAKVRQGFDNTVWSNMKSYLDRLIEEQDLIEEYDSLRELAENDMDDNDDDYHWNDEEE